MSAYLSLKPKVATYTFKCFSMFMRRMASGQLFVAVLCHLKPPCTGLWQFWRETPAILQVFSLEFFAKLIIPGIFVSLFFLSPNNSLIFVGLGKCGCVYTGRIISPSPVSAFFNVFGAFSWKQQCNCSIFDLSGKLRNPFLPDANHMDKKSYGIDIYLKEFSIAFIFNKNSLSSIWVVSEYQKY